MANTDLSALLKSEAIRAVLRAPQPQGVQGCGQDQPPQEHSVHASAEPLRRCGEEERQGQGSEGGQGRWQASPCKPDGKARKQGCQEGQEVDVVTAVPLDRLDCRCQSLGGNVLKN